MAVAQNIEECQNCLPEHHDLPLSRFVTGIVLGIYFGWLLGWIFLNLLPSN